MRSGRNLGASRTRENYELNTMTFDEESAYVDEEGDPAKEPYGGLSNAERKRSRLSFYLNRRSTGAAQYWQKRQQKEAQENAVRDAAMDSVDPTPQAYRSAAQQALVSAMDVNKETLRAIEHIEHVMNETEAIGQESAGMIRRGQENLEVVDDTLGQMEPTLKRAKRDLIQFFRQMMRDRFLVCLVFVVLALVITVIIVSKVKGKPSLPFEVNFPPANRTGF